MEPQSKRRCLETAPIPTLSSVLQILVANEFLRGKELSNLASVSKELCQCATDDSIWKTLWHKNFPCTGTTPVDFVEQPGMYRWLSMQTKSKPNREQSFDLKWYPPLPPPAFTIHNIVFCMQLKLNGKIFHSFRIQGDDLKALVEDGTTLIKFSTPQIIGPAEWGENSFGSVGFRRTIIKSYDGEEQFPVAMPYEFGLTIRMVRSTEDITEMCCICDGFGGRSSDPILARPLVAQGEKVTRASRLDFSGLRTNWTLELSDATGWILSLKKTPTARDILDRLDEDSEFYFESHANLCVQDGYLTTTDLRLSLYHKSRGGNGLIIADSGYLNQYGFSLLHYLSELEATTSFPCR